MQSPFFQKIYKIIRRIPKGKVATYGQIAALAGNPRAARTVGWALHSAGDDSLPWHRVINGRGQSSFPVAGKRKLQRALLEKEGILFEEENRVNLDVFQWDGRMA